MTDERVVAAGPRIERHLSRLGERFSCAWPVDEAPCFGELLAAINDADRLLCNARDEERLIADPQHPLARR